MIWKLWHWESQYNHIHPKHFHTLSLVIGMVYLLPVLCMTKVDLGQRFSIHSFSACTLKLHLTFYNIFWVSYILCEGNLHFWNQIYKCVNLGFLNKSQFLDVLERACLIDGSFKPPIFFNGYKFCAHIHGLSIQLNKPGYKDCFGRKKMEARRNRAQDHGGFSNSTHTHIGRFADVFTG